MTSKSKLPTVDPLLELELQRRSRFTAARERPAEPPTAPSPIDAARESAAWGTWSDGRRMRPNRPPYSIT